MLLCLDFSQLSKDDISSIKFFDIISSNEEAKKLLNVIVGKGEQLSKSDPFEEEEPDGWPEKAINRMRTFQRGFGGVPCFVASRDAETFGPNLSPIVYYYDESIRSLQPIATISKTQITSNCIGFRVCAIGKRM